MQKYYIITGGGRTGSHWVEQIVRYLDPEAITDHTNEHDDLLNYPARVKTNSILVPCFRRDKFASVISFFVAVHTQEWFNYDIHREIVPIRISEEEFKQKLQDTYRWDDNFNIRVRPQFQPVIDIWYEDLISNKSPEDYIKDKLNIPTQLLPNHWGLSKNPRDYSKIVVNYQELREIYLQNQ